MGRRAKVEMFEQIRREYEFGVGTVKGVAEKFGVHRRTVRQALESAVIDTVADYGVVANARRDAPGVYVAGAKLAAVGLRVKRHCSYHGLAVNVAMDLTPFAGINPCGYANLPVTDLRTLAGIQSIEEFRREFEPRLIARLAPSC